MRNGHLFPNTDRKSPIVTGALSFLKGTIVDLLIIGQFFNTQLQNAEGRAKPNGPQVDFGSEFEGYIAEIGYIEVHSEISR